MKLSTIKEFSFTTICMTVLFTIVFFMTLNSKQSIDDSLLAAFVITLIFSIPIYTFSISVTKDI